MRCEVCGSHLREKPIKAVIEGAKLEVCSQCAKLSTGTWEKQWPGFAPFPRPASSSRVRPLKPTRRPIGRQDESEYVLIRNYGEIVRRAREKRGWSQEELGSAVNEKESLIAKIETQKIVPPLAIALKIEHVLGVRLTEEAPTVVDSKVPTAKSMELTLGDVVVMKKRENN